ncbi:hypothetical protein H1C71_031295, partial [Ictidomys tridecemlineatus]
NAGYSQSSCITCACGEFGCVEPSFMWSTAAVFPNFFSHSHQLCKFNCFRVFNRLVYSWPIGRRSLDLVWYPPGPSSPLISTRQPEHLMDFIQLPYLMGYHVYG